MPVVVGGRPAAGLVVGVGRQRPHRCSRWSGSQCPGPEVELGIGRKVVDWQRRLRPLVVEFVADLLDMRMMKWWRMLKMRKVVGA